MEASFSLGMELSSTATTNGATSFVREAVERELGLGEGEAMVEELVGTIANLCSPSFSPRHLSLLSYANQFSLSLSLSLSLSEPSLT